MQTKDLTGELLNYWVARALGYRFWKETRGMRESYTLCVQQPPGAREPWRGRRDWEAQKERYTEALTFADIQIGFFGDGVPNFSTDWAQGGPIIERERIQLMPWRPELGNVASWSGRTLDSWQESAATPLVAAMRAYVASKFGDTVPDETGSAA
jgi:hypothetical protein